MNFAEKLSSNHLKLSSELIQVLNEFTAQPTLSMLTEGWEEEINGGNFENHSAA